jgi:hypothetical protein
MFNFTALEFMAAGTPVICSEGAGVSELIEHGKNGFKYPADDSEALAQLIKMINELNDTAHTRITNAAVETIKRILDPETIIKKNIELYQAIQADFKPNLPNRYLDEIYRPSEKQYSVNKTLDKQSFKSLLFYFSRRIKSKMLK